MRGRWTVLALVGLLGLGGLASAQDGASGGKTVTRDEVKSWIFDVDGKEWSVRPSAPTTMGDSGLFRLVGSAYTLPKGYFSFGYSYDNVDRNPKGTDFATHGVNFGYGVSNRSRSSAPWASRTGPRRTTCSSPAARTSTRSPTRASPPASATSGSGPSTAS